MPHGRHIKDERIEIRLGNSSLGGSSHQTGDAAFTPATPQQDINRAGAAGVVAAYAEMALLRALRVLCAAHMMMNDDARGSRQNSLIINLVLIEHTGPLFMQRIRYNIGWSICQWPDTKRRDQGHRENRTLHASQYMERTHGRV